jgi:bacterioferritin B
MRISPELNAAFNAQIGRELHSSNQYVNMAAHFDDRAMKLLAKLFFDQAAEEREHAMKFVHYLTNVDGKVEIPAIEAAKAEFATVEEAIRLAYDWEVGITKNINDLVDLAIAKKDYAAQEFLKWFVTEQVEEVKKMDDLVKIVTMVGERNVIMVEAYLVHNEAMG